MTHQRPTRAVYMRGGTSKGVFFHARDLPAAGAERDSLLLRLMGSPDPLQIDGMGGTYSSTSKVVVVDEPDDDGVITYWFGQVAIEEARVDWRGNCGNLTTAVGPFCVDEGLAQPVEPVTEVRLLNGNTGTDVRAEVPVRERRAVVEGEHVVDGVPGTGAPVVTRYLHPGGRTTGALLPTGASIHDVGLPSGSAVSVSVVDAAAVFVFVRASDLGVDVDAQSVAERNADPELLNLVEHIRAQVAMDLGLVDDPSDAAALSPTVPRIALIGPGRNGDDVSALAVSMGVFHRALPMTGALCTAAAATIPGTIVAAITGGGRAESTATRLMIGHPRGHATVEVESEHGVDGVVLSSLGVTRTARRIMDGNVYTP